MIREVPGRCPVCGSFEEVTSVSCPACSTKIEGRFQLCRFCRLTEDQKVFLNAFIKCRGNIKEVEKELNISYPTVKNRLEDVASALGYGNDTYSGEDTKNQRKRILEMLDNNEITTSEAIEMLNNLN